MKAANPKKRCFISERIVQTSLIIIVLVAALLRFYRLDGQSLWADEGNSVALAGRDLATIARNAACDIHPPLYYWLLHFWVMAFGQSEIAIRSLSALLGIALVYLTFLLGCRLFGRRVGLTAALLSALSPFQVYYSQEARMYILATLLGASSVLLFVELVEKESEGQVPPTHLDLLYIIATALGLYTHYSFPLVIAVENLTYILWLVTSRGRERCLRRLWRWLAIQLAIVALYLPWLPIAYRGLTHWPSISEAHSFSFIASEALRLHSLGLTVERSELTMWLMAGFVFIFLAGLFPSKPTRRSAATTHKNLSTSQSAEESALSCADRGVRERPTPLNSELRNLRTYLLLLYCLSPVLLMGALSLVKPTYRPKFFLVGSPAFYLVLAKGIIRLRLHRLSPIIHYLLPATCLLFIGATSAWSLHNYYFDPKYARDDYRGIARYISAREDEGDAILLNAPGQWEVFTYYYRGPSPVHPLPRSRPLDEASTAKELEEMAARYDWIFAVLWATDESDPGRFVEGWLDDHAYKAMDTWYGNVRLVIYAVPQVSPPAGIQHPLQAILGDEIAFLGYKLLSDRVRSGETLQLTLFWQALARPKERYRVFVQVLDRANHIVGQRDSEPGGGANITTIWQPGQTVTDNYGVLICSGTPPGNYRLQIGMYELDSGRRLKVDGEDRIVLQSIEVLRPEEPPSLAILGIQHEEEIEYGELAFLGYDLHKLNCEHLPEAPLHPGDALHLSLYWRALQAPEVEWRLNLRLMDARGEVWWATEGVQLSEGYPTAKWQEGEVVRGQFHIPIPAEAGGRCRVWAQLVPEGGEPLQPFVSDWFVIR